MVTSVAELTHLFVPAMVERGWGRILNVASIYGLMYGAPGSTLYPAAKGFVIKFSESLAAELAGAGVRVTALCPGFTRSEFHEVNGMRHMVTGLPNALWMDAESVARQGVAASMEGRVLVVSGIVYKLITSAMQHLPHAVARSMMERQANNLKHAALPPGSNGMPSAADCYRGRES